MVKKIADESASKISKPRKPMLRFYVSCEAVLGDAVKSGACTFETKRHPRVRTAEIEYQKHALSVHSRVVKVEVELERREKIVS